MAKGNGGGGFFAGLIVGSLVGAALALLYAPQPGEQTREQLFGERGVLPDRARATVEGLVGRGRAFVEQARTTLREAVAEGKAEAERTRLEMYRRYEERARGGSG